jgi:hypothetical protein
MFNLNQNRDIANNLINDFDLNQLTDITPAKVNTSIQPVYEVYGKVVNVTYSNSAVNATSATIATTPTDKDFYISAITLSMIKDASATSTISTVTATINNVSSTLTAIRTLTLTAQAQTITLCLTVPVKIDRGTNILVTNATAVGNISTNATIQGYFKYNRTNVGS